MTTIKGKLSDLAVHLSNKPRKGQNTAESRFGKQWRLESAYCSQCYINVGVVEGSVDSVLAMMVIM